MRLDADDWLDMNALQIMSNYLEKNPKIGLVFPDYFEVDELGKIINLVRRHNFKKVKLYIYTHTSNILCVKKNVYYAHVRNTYVFIAHYLFLL